MLLRNDFLNCVIMELYEQSRVVMETDEYFSVSQVWGGEDIVVKVDFNKLSKTFKQVNW